MKKQLLLTIFLLSLTTMSVQALSWAYTFVVWKGNVYEVQQDVQLEASQIQQMIGRVTTRPDAMTGDYYGNASNEYQVGTKYFKIKDISTSEAIAVQADTVWLKAEYVHEAPFHLMNILMHPLFFFAIVLSAIIIFIYVRRRMAHLPVNDKKRS